MGKKPTEESKRNIRSWKYRMKYERKKNNKESKIMAARKFDLFVNKGVILIIWNFNKFVLFHCFVRTFREINLLISFKENFLKEKYILSVLKSASTNTTGYNNNYSKMKIEQ